MDSLTEQYNFVKQFNSLAAEVYYDKKHFLTYAEIAEHRHIKSSEAKLLYTTAKRLLKDPESAWMEGLSNHAKNALTKNGYTKMKQLLDDVMTERVDLECLKGLGHKAAVEIRRWCITHS